MFLDHDFNSDRCNEYFLYHFVIFTQYYKYKHFSDIFGIPQNVKSLLDVTSITRAYLSRKGSPRTFLFEMLVHSHIPFIRELNSRHLRNIAMYFQHTKYLAPEVWI